jgi:hypothetical protein
MLAKKAILSSGSVASEDQWSKILLLENIAEYQSGMAWMYTWQHCPEPDPRRLFIE